MKGSGWERNKVPLKLGSIIHLSRVKKHEMLKKLHLTQFLLRLDTGEKKEEKKSTMGSVSKIAPKIAHPFIS